MKTSTHRKALFSSSGLVLGTMAMLAMPTTALAQIDEIVTTAQRTSENLQDVPVAVTAISLEDIEERQVYDVLDLQTLVPNINLATNTGTANAARIFLRGVGEDESRGAVDQAVGIYVDGVYVGRSVGSLFDLVDLENIQVLRGPQGTLYGRNSNGGAIKLTSVKPQTDGNSASARVTVGNYDRFDVRAVGNLALGENTAIRATGMYRSRDGFHTLNPNGARADIAGTNVGEQEVIAGRLMLSHDFGEDWNLLISLDRTEDNSDPIPDSIAPGNDVDNNIFTIEPAPGTTCPATGGFLGFSLGCFAEYDNETISQGVNATLSGGIGNFDITSITAYRELDDALNTRIGFPYSQMTDQDQFSQELVAASDLGGAFDFVAGLYYFTENLTLDSTFIFPFSIDTSTESFAVFAQGTFEVTDRLGLTAGVRFTDEDKDFDGTGPFGFARIDEQSFNNTSFTLKADYKLTEDAMVYASYATGFKSGGWSPDAFNALGVFLPVDEEKVGTFEIGARTQFWDNRAQFNVTFFSSQYDDLQIGASVPASSFDPTLSGNVFTRFNVNETSIRGLEVEWKFEPTESFTLSGNLGLLDAEYKDLDLFQAAGLTGGGASCPGGVITVECALGLELKSAPEYKATIAAVYRQSALGGTISYSGDISFEDESWSLVANNPPHALAEIPTLINARVAYEPDDSFWSVALWAKNLTDEEYYRASSGTAFTTYASEPATYGVDVGVNF